MNCPSLRFLRSRLTFAFSMNRVLFSFLLFWGSFLPQTSHAQAPVSPTATTLSARFPAPAGFQRTTTASTSFETFLRQLPLKPWGSKVLYFDGRSKNTPNVYVSVVDLSIGKKDLHQCADAVMRLRAEYLFQQKQFEKIHFNFLADGKPRYFSTYAKGSYSYPIFWKYMEYIFASANTRSLHDELQPISIQHLKIGDVFIQKGVPFGHAVMVVDMVQNPTTGQKLFLLAQSYMPAQETQILKNPNNAALSPWYELKNETLKTPEWTFEPSDVRRFKEN